MNARRAALTRSGSRWRERGFLMVESLIYITALLAVLAVAFSAFYRVMTTHGDLRRNAGDIARALHAGERWRADLRAATAPLRVVREGEITALEIPQPGGVVAYVFEANAIWRHAGVEEPQLFLAGVARSVMEREARSRTVAWRWDLELETKKKLVRVRPLFTFRAVSGGEVAP